ncbi:MAG: single-stranded-DNA-specific exonuclease RecJ [Eubacteriales bacterium]|jgi:single-stranded-DNA-specific exonuclease|nr:single-stranded-DNA-specific exonuclease RecJ [Eubacteriales bacterium]
MNNRLIAREPVNCDPAFVETIADQLNCSQLIARALIRRGVSSLEEARRFLEPKESDLLDPFLLPDMQVAADRVRRAIDDGEHICVFGDYDADGVCSTAMLVQRLRKMGASVEYYIPHRHTEGYGMSADAVRTLNEHGVRLIVTVDNGVSAFDEIALCTVLGIDVVVTDHHSVSKTLPQCAAVVAASRKDACYPNRYLCGAGVALKLIQALNDGTYAPEELALAAIATIADVVPLTGENRAIAACGLKHIQSLTGLSALLHVAGFNQPRVDEMTVSFIIAPRLNAAGRMATAMEAVHLLLGEDDTRAEEIAATLNEYNQRRRDTENEILEEAERLIAACGQIGRVILLAHESWNAGVIGIVASRLCEKYHLPVILFADQEGVLTGSGRSIAGVDLFEALSLFSHLFVRFGGHARAAGVTITRERFEAFRPAFEQHVEDNYRAEDFYPAYQFDETVRFGELTVPRVKELRLLSPYGEGNAEPVFRFNNVRFASLRTIGKDDKHFCASAVQADQVMRVIAFGKSQLLEPLNKAADWDLLARPTINAYRGSESVELFWICANASEEKIAFYNAFFQQRLYNGDCSDGRIAEWYGPRSDRFHAELDDVAMRKHYRRLQNALSEGSVSLFALIRALRNEELLALCVFTQLTFFTYDTETGHICLNTNCATRTLGESPLYQMLNDQQEA